MKTYSLLLGSGTQECDRYICYPWCRWLQKSFQVTVHGTLVHLQISKSSSWSFRQFPSEWSFSYYYWFPGWELSHALPYSPPLNGFTFLGFWTHLNFPIISFPAFPLISVPLVLVFTQFCGLVWPFSIPVCRLSSSNPLCVPQGGAFGTSAASLTFAFHVLSAW